MSDSPVLAHPVTEDEANALLRIGEERIGTVTIRRQSGDEPSEKDMVVAVVYGEEFARSLVDRWNHPLMSPSSWREYVGRFAASR